MSLENALEAVVKAAEENKWSFKEVVKFLATAEKAPENIRKFMLKTGSYTVQNEKQNEDSISKVRGYIPEKLSEVLYILQDRRKHTVPELATILGYSQTATSSFIRDLRKQKNGGFKIAGFFEGKHYYYQLTDWRVA